MQPDELALAFRCEDDTLYGVLSAPAAPAARGVLIVVGGPQYRAGSHRQFTLLARALARQGIPAMRFDYRGMGDSSGAPRNFEAVEADLRAAVDQFYAASPGLQEVVLWGLCDAASASLFYARHDPRVRGLVLLNPWVRTAQGEAKATLKHYYRQRLMAPELWRKLLRGRFDYRAAWQSLRRVLAGARSKPASGDGDGASLPQRMLAGWQGFAGPILLITSGNDLTAREFLDLGQDDPHWHACLAAARVQRQSLAEADHTFSRAAWRAQVEDWTAAWLRDW